MMCMVKACLGDCKTLYTIHIEVDAALLWPCPLTDPSSWQLSTSSTTPPYHHHTVSPHHHHTTSPPQPHHISSTSLLCPPLTISLDPSRTRLRWSTFCEIDQTSAICWVHVCDVEFLQWLASTPSRQEKICQPAKLRCPSYFTFESWQLRSMHYRFRRSLRCF